MQVVEIAANERSAFGKSSNKVLRSNGEVPGVIYSKNGVHHFSTSPKALKSIVYTPDFKKANIDIGGKKLSCILQDIQFHPVTDKIVHIDFIELVSGSPIKVELPVSFEGSSPGEKAGGKLIQNLRRVKVKCLPKDLVDLLVVNISELELGGVVRVSDIELPAGIELISQAATPVAGVEIPRALKSEEAAEEAAAGADTTEAEAPAAEEG